MHETQNQGLVFAPHPQCNQSPLTLSHPPPPDECGLDGCCKGSVAEAASATALDTLQRFSNFIISDITDETVKMYYFWVEVFVFLASDLCQKNCYWYKYEGGSSGLQTSE